MDLDYEDPAQNLSIHIKKGQNHFTGKDVIDLLKFRIPSHISPDMQNHYDGSDLKRIEAQQNMFKALIEQKFNMHYFSKISDIVKIALDNTETNMSLNDCLNLTKDIHKINPKDVKMFILPGQEQTVGSKYYYTIDDEASQNIVKSHFQSQSGSK